MSYHNMGVFDGGIITPKQTQPVGMPVMDAAGIASGNAFLTSELEKRDPIIRQPLTSVTYPRDVPIETGGGWVEFASAMSVQYGVTGGSGDSTITAGGANGIPIVQASLDKGLFQAHVYSVALRIMFVDMQKSSYIGRSLDQLLQEGVRLSYDKHMDENVYAGFAQYGTYGLVNHPDVTETTVADGAKGTSNWKDKTPDEILLDINTAISATWEAAGFDTAAIPNHILVPYEQYLYLLNTKVSDLATKSILDYLLENNIVNKEGKGQLFIGATAWCKGAGTGGKDRMVVYVNHERYIGLDELVPLNRIMTQPNVAHVCYDTAYMANISEIKMMYPNTVTYWDGIGGDE